jgi:hypothetical protein
MKRELRVALGVFAGVALLRMIHRPHWTVYDWIVAIILAEGVVLAVRGIPHGKQA